MNKAKKPLLISILILLILTIIILCSCISLLTMKPAETGIVLNTELLAVKNGRNASFLVKTDDGYILFDAGSDAKQFAASLKEISININDIKWIFLSHSDMDHVASLPLFPNAEIYMSKDELQLINGTTKRNPFGGNSMPKGINISKLILLSDEQELSPGGMNIKCIAAPGHTPGSMMYLISDKYLFTGDAFKLTGSDFDVHPFTMDSKLSKATIERLKETINKCSIVLTSHYGIMVNK